VTAREKEALRLQHEREEKQAAERKQREEAERQKREEAERERQAREEQERLKREEEERYRREEAERKQRALLEQEAIERKKREEEERQRKEKELAERKQREEKEAAERKQREEQERKRKEEEKEEERKRKEEEERKQKEEEERKQKAEADRAAAAQQKQREAEEEERKQQKAIERQKRADERAAAKAKRKEERAAVKKADELKKRKEAKAKAKAKEEDSKTSAKTKDASSAPLKPWERDALDKQSAIMAGERAEAGKKAREGAAEPTVTTPAAAVSSSATASSLEDVMDGAMNERPLSSITRDRAMGHRSRRLPSRASRRISQSPAAAGTAQERLAALREAQEALAEQRRQRRAELTQTRQTRLNKARLERVSSKKLEDEARQAKLLGKEQTDRARAERRQRAEEEFKRRAEEEEERRRKQKAANEQMASLRKGLRRTGAAAAGKRAAAGVYLYQCKGRRSVAVHLVAPERASLNQGDVFVLRVDSKHMLYVWNGSECSRMERAKGTEVAVKLKSREARGAKVVQLEHDDLEEGFWSELGGRGEVATAEAGGNDITFERECKERTKLYRVCESGSQSDEDDEDDAESGDEASTSGTAGRKRQYEVEVVECQKLTRDLLDSSYAYVLDTQRSEVYAWVGKQSPEGMRSYALQYARQLGAGHPPHGVVERVAQNGEPLLFTLKFAVWPDHVPLGARGRANSRRVALAAPKQGTGAQARHVSSAAGARAEAAASASGSPQVDVTKLHTAVRPQEDAVDNGEGTIESWRLNGGKMVREPEGTGAQAGHFHSGCCYNLVYTFMKGRAFRYTIYYWQGRDCRQQDRGIASMLVKEAVQEVKSRGAEPLAQRRVVQNKEPRHFLSIFQGERRMIVHAGHPDGPSATAPPRLKGKAGKTGKGSSVAAAASSGVESSAAASSAQLYQVCGRGDLECMRAHHVPATASSLNSGDMFLLRTAQRVYVWQGAGASFDAHDVCEALAPRLAQLPGAAAGDTALPVETLKEGDEPSGFWEALGGRQEYPNERYLRLRNWKPRLYLCSGAAANAFRVEPVWDYAQEDLSPDNVFMLDAVHEVYLWVGPWSNEADRTAAMQMALEYVQKAFDGRLATTPIYSVEAGKEPPTFVIHFLGWKGKVGDRLDRSGAVQEVRSALDKLNQTYTYEQLTGPNRPKGLDASRLETYLSDAEFQELFQMSRESFEQLPAWIRLRKRQDLSLQ